MPLRYRARHYMPRNVVGPWGPFDLERGQEYSEEVFRTEVALPHSRRIEERVEARTRPITRIEERLDTKTKQMVPVEIHETETYEEMVQVEVVDTEVFDVAPLLVKGGLIELVE